MQFENTMNASSPLFHLSSYQWMDIIQYLDAEDFKSLRLAGSICIDPALTSHLQLRMDRAPFFCDESYFPEEDVRQWLVNRHKLVINDANAPISPSRVAYLAANGFLNAVSQIVISNCHSYRTTIYALSKLPNVDSLVLTDHNTVAVDELEAIVSHVENMQSLKSLDIEFACVIDGSRLSFLRDLQGLSHLRLRGFDLSQGLQNLRCLRSLESLHLCHGNFYSSPDEDVNVKDLAYLNSLTKLQKIHLEGFDCLTGICLQPLCASGSLQHLYLKHCQELNENTLPCIGHNMTTLKSLHIINTPYEDVPEFDDQSLDQLNNLTSLKSLSLFYALHDPDDLNVLQNLTSLETLNLALEEDVDEIGVDYMYRCIFPTFKNLRKVRIFSEEAMEYSYQRGNLEIEFARFNFGDIVCLD